MAEDRRQNLRELELEYRYLTLVRLEADMARVGWLSKLAIDLKESMCKFWQRIEAGEE